MFLNCLPHMNRINHHRMKFKQDLIEYYFFKLFNIYQE